MEQQGWIKIHRKIVDWQWYKDIPCRILFEHLLYTTNHKPAIWHMHEIKRGEKITSTENLAFETGLTKAQVRYALKKLKLTGEIAIKTTNKFTLITVVSYESYQGIDKQNDKPLANQSQTNDKPLATNKNEKNKDNEKNERENTHTLFNFCLKVLPEEDREPFRFKPEEYLPTELGQEWIDRKGADYEKAMWKCWAKFFNHHLEKPARDDWKTLWINWIINEVVYDVQKNRA
jgi:hypothetical protein